MKSTGKKIIIAISLLFYLGTVQAMAMLTPVGFDNKHCQSHSMTANMQSAETINLVEESEHTHLDGNHCCMACFAMAIQATNDLNHSQPLIDLQRSIQKEFHSITLNTLSPPPKSSLN